MYSLIKKLLFTLPPEKAHDLALELAKLSPVLGKFKAREFDSRMALRVGNHEWKFPIGLAAGLDKNAEALSFFKAQGFGSVECGTVTLKPQLGNPKPRLFRYPTELSLRNSMGFPNQGLAEILPRLRNFEGGIPLGINLGKNKDTTPEESIEELCLLFESVQEWGQYFVINVSSPNTPGLRALQERSYLSELFKELNKIRTPKNDLYLKIAPDLEERKIIELTQLAFESGLTGLIATNTTMIPERGAGGVSGALLKEKAQKVRSIILRENLDLELIGVGGIAEFKDLLELWREGGKVAQVYTSYIYQGPVLLQQYQRQLEEFLKRQNLSTLQTFFDLKKEERIDRLKNYPA